MSSQLTVKAVDRDDDHYQVQFRETDDFDDLTTPDWARELAESELPGSDVQMGREETDEWRIQSVRVPADRVDGDGDAARKALQVVSLVTDHEMFESE
ncbi:hypothetical protein [Haloarcula salinisoli]|uniref:Uncharacterized protein n=1 Tax=Haloarcula salinisoli TaxID=2487746 RepID=A0A8J8C9E8_9EURY|nr:hypothetical protein [Halomicroarcula salinisoli]MBX0286837.1 hypothetical protein [Halomicroarcula salinisoli]MBX0304139.1 hypothetical protein [Halomicroarcula salinisoli]